jgi:hypothetical protein
LVKRFDLRGLVCFGSLVFAASCWLNNWMSPDYAGDQFVFSNVIRALGIASATNFIQGFALYGSVYLLPQYLTIVQDYDAFQIGQTVALSTFT